ncbi:MAG: AAA family ATPase, partial [Dehalococcoidia bacterium]|nr:AAA family ATPase [Dehalococcoidia bacterium]
AGKTLPPSPVPAWALYVFGKDDVSQDGGRELLWKEGSAVAFDSDEDFTNLAREGHLTVSTDFKDEDPDSWAAARNLQIAARIPEETEAPELWAFFEGDDAAAPDVLERIVKFLQAAFTLIPASRHVPSSGSARASMLNPDVAYALTQLGISQARTAEKTWYRIKKDIGALLGKDLDPNPTQFQFWHSQIRLPHEQVGGGEQSVLQLWWHVIQAKGIVGVEEPEIHLHPGLGKQVFEAFQKNAGANQIILSTHSPMFVDKAEDACNWLFTIQDLETTAQLMKTPEQIKLMMAELGMVPSDIFLKDFVLFVEGGTEKEAVFPIWAEKMGLLLRANPRVGMVAVGGDSQVIRFLRPWIEVMEYAPAEYMVVLDAHGGAVRDELESKLKIDRSKIRVLPKHCIEDYYPRDLIRAALRDVFGLQEIPDVIRDDNCAEELDRLIKEEKGNQPGWKVALGQYVASRMDAKQIPPEVRAIFDDIKKRFSPARSRQRRQ